MHIIVVVRDGSSCLQPCCGVAQFLDRLYQEVLPSTNDTMMAEEYYKQWLKCLVFKWACWDAYVASFVCLAVFPSCVVIAAVSCKSLCVVIMSF